MGFHFVCKLRVVYYQYKDIIWEKLDKTVHIYFLTYACSKQFFLKYYSKLKFCNKAERKGVTKLNINVEAIVNIVTRSQYNGSIQFYFQNIFSSRY